MQFIFFSSPFISIAYPRLAPPLHSIQKFHPRTRVASFLAVYGLHADDTARMSERALVIREKSINVREM